jgi:hypothetical protein
LVFARVGPTPKATIDNARIKLLMIFLLAPECKTAQ